jgi:hypothetical protein
MQVESSIDIQRPIEDVFTFITQVKNAAKWQDSTVETRQTSPGPMGAGATMHHVGKFLGRRIENDAKVYEFELNRTFAYKGGGALPVDIRYRFEPIACGTKFTVIYGGEPGAFFKLAEPLVKRASAKLLAGDLKKLKQVLEAS